MNETTDLATQAAKTDDPAEWLYILGVPRFHADAFGEYYRLYCAGWTFSAAKSKFDHDPRGHALYDQHARRPDPRYSDHGGSDDHADR